MIVYKNRIISTGYVGSRPGEPHCIDEGCIIDPVTKGCVRTDHAEANAINFMKRGCYPSDIELVELYCTLSPCLDCSKLIVEAGIKKVIYLIKYRKNEGISYLIDNGVIVDQYRGKII